MTKQACRVAVDILRDNSGKLIRRFVSTPKMTPDNIRGSEDFWEMMLNAMKTECRCSLPKTKKAIKESYSFYRKSKVGKAALRMAKAGVAISDEAKKCGLR